IAIVFDQKWIGQMPRLLQHRKNIARRPLAVEFNCRNDPLSDAMIQILEKDTCFSLPCDRKGIGIETMTRIRNRLPAWPREIPALPNPCIIGVPPSDMPVWRITAQAVYFHYDRTGYAAEDIRHEPSRDRTGAVGHR